MTVHQKLILAIETSCDETAAAVVRGREVHANIIASQAEIHAKYGGVVPCGYLGHHPAVLRVDPGL